MICEFKEEIYMIYGVIPLQQSQLFPKYTQSKTHRADSRFAPSQWETSLQSNAVFRWLNATLELALNHILPAKLWYGMSAVTSKLRNRVWPQNNRVSVLQNIHNDTRNYACQENGRLIKLKQWKVVAILSQYLK